LLIGVHIIEAMHLPHFRQYDWSPFDQVLKVLALDRVLVLRVALTTADAQILPCLQKRHRPWDPGELGTQAIDYLA
jgi:hypothetical protein